MGMGADLFCSSQTGLRHLDISDIVMQKCNINGLGFLKIAKGGTLENIYTIISDFAASQLSSLNWKLNGYRGGEHASLHM